MAILFVLPLVLLSGTARAGERLPPLNADITQTSVSGISSGGAMAVQFHVAYSSLVKGAGVLAGVPFACAGNSASKAVRNCMQPDSSHPVPPLNELVSLTDQLVGSGAIDATTHLAGDRGWLFSGTNDAIVKQPVMDRLYQYYQYYIPTRHISYEKAINAGHAMIVSGEGSPCSYNGKPFINDCQYDAAGFLLTQVYGSLKPRGAPLSGSVIEYHQREFFGTGDHAAYVHSMSDSGFAYIPAPCSTRPCRVHVAFHGCKQNYEAVGDQFYTRSGFNEWADANDLIVLYPQTIARYGWNWREFWTVKYTVNPEACWDWWGYDTPNYYTQHGPQMRSTKSMLDRLASPRATR